MNKIICEVCGTSYSEAATQCPICGCIRSMENENHSVDEFEHEVEQPHYQYVKGGRFSKANVKKRNKNKKNEDKVSVKKESNQNKDKQSNKGLVITVLVLLLAIIAVIAYIAITIIIPIMLPSDNEPSQVVETEYNAVASSTEPQLISCTDILTDPEELVFENIGDSMQILATPMPENTTDVLAFNSVDESIVTVDNQGVVTAVNFGETTIIIECGSFQAFCPVTVLEPAPEFTFNRDDITLAAAGDEWLVYDGSIALSDITWSSEDETIAMIVDGKIIAVGQGVTTVFGEFDGTTASCIVRCEFAEESENEIVADNGPYRLDNPYGVSDTDASIYVGGSFTLYLLDKDDEKVTGVTWSVEGGSCCTVEDGLITGVSKGQANVVATYGGEKYICIVRVS